jgi:hypothetical protein
MPYARTSGEFGELTGKFGKSLADAGEWLAGYPVGQAQRDLRDADVAFQAKKIIELP